MNETIQLTEKAAEEIRLLREREKIPVEKYLRIGVKGGGCSGLSYVLDFDEKQAMDDEFQLHGISVLVDKRQALYLVGTYLDYQSGLNDRGFVFLNPNAKSTCGCGTSFAT